MTEEQTLSMDPETNSENVESVEDLSAEEKESLMIGDAMEQQQGKLLAGKYKDCLLYTSPSPRDATLSRMPSSA